ncbi:MAG TPA: ABC transporter permease [Gemmatimonadota bacterium]|nr:ABC transporter permease [Gemmatimonadota bacterium]
MTLHRTLAIARKEILQLRRDPRSLALGFLIPPFLIVFFGYAITFDVDDIRLAVWDADRTQTSSRLVDAFVASGYFRVVERLERYPDVTRVLQSGDALAVLAIPRGFTRDLASGGGAPLQLLVDGSDANTATIAIEYAQGIGTAFSRRATLGGRQVRPALVPDIRAWYNPSLDSRNMVVPGLVAVIISILAALLTALTLAREWERGTMEQLVSTPVTRLEIVTGKLLPYLAIGLFDVLLAVGIGTLLFDVPFRGSLLLLLAMTSVFLLAALGFGMLLSAALKSQVLATQFAIVGTYLPALLLSGFIFSIANMPRVLQLATYLFPARYYVTVTKAIFLKGVGIEVLWPQGLLLAALASIAIVATVAIFRKEVA